MFVKNLFSICRPVCGQARLPVDDDAAHVGGAYGHQPEGAVAPGALHHHPLVGVKEAWDGFFKDQLTFLD